MFSIAKGFAIEAQLDKIVLVDEKLFSIVAAKGSGGPQVSIATFSQPNHPVAEYRLPHIFINGSLRLLGLSLSLYARVTIAGIEFDLDGTLLPGVNFDVTALFGKTGLEAHGTVKVGIGTLDLGALGKAKINTNVEADLDLDIDVNPANIELTLEASFEFAGQTIKVAKFKCDAKPDTFAKLPELLGKQMEAALREVFKDAGQWANAVGKGVMDGVTDTEKVFKNVYGKSDQAAKELAKQAGSGVKQAEKAVDSAVSSAGKEVSKGANSVKKSVQEDSLVTRRRAHGRVSLRELQDRRPVSVRPRGSPFPGLARRQT